MDRRAHWDRVFETKQPDEVSWYQRTPERSLEYIRRLTDVDDRIIDIGSGASLLVEALLDVGYRRLVALDVSAAALERSRARLGSRATAVEWRVGDVTEVAALPPAELWHDRAVLHFLVDPREQVAYADLARRTVCPGGHIVIGAFALDGPERCSGLPVQRHDSASLQALFGSEFLLLEATKETHVTPAGKEQGFQWAVFRRRSS